MEATELLPEILWSHNAENGPGAVSQHGDGAADGAGRGRIRAGRGDSYGNQDRTRCLYVIGPWLF